MFVSKVNNMTFKGYTHEINGAGDSVYRFNYPHDKESQKVTIEFYRAGASKESTPIKTIELDKTNTINFNEIPEFGENEQVTYRVKVNDKYIIDSGLRTENNFNVINTKVTTPMHSGQAILTMPDIHRPGALYKDFSASDTGKIVYDKERQKASEKVIRTYSNIGGGTLAGLEYDMDLFKELGVKTLFMTPVWSAKPGHYYWSTNDMQIAPTIGNIENYETFTRKALKNGIRVIDDYAVTSFGLESLAFNYARRWAGHNPQTQNWLIIPGLKDAPLGLGVVSKKSLPNLRHKVINPTVIYNPETQKIEKNPDYNPQKGTFFQIYDVTQVSDEQASNNEIIVSYDKTYSDNKLQINNSEDTIVNYVFDITPQEYEARLEAFVKQNKTLENPIELNSPEGTLFIGQNKTLKIGTCTEGAKFWDDNRDIIKRNYYSSGYSEKLMNAIPNLDERNYKRELLQRANCEVQDMAMQTAIYRTQTVKDFQILYMAQMLQNASTSAEIDALTKTVLPEKAKLTDEAVENIKDGFYALSDKGVETKDDVTTRALMKLPLDSLELGNNTSEVLMTSYFTNRASSKDTIGMSRFDFFKNGAGVYSPYHTTYHKVDRLFAEDIKDFAHEVIDKVNETSSEKLLDENGNYTEYGEYVIDLIGKDIAKYAFLKSFAGDKLETKLMPDDVLKGKITYNYDKLREETSLEALEIKASSPEDEAKQLLDYITSGMKSLKSKDVDYVAQAVSKRIEGTTTLGFRLAEAMYNKASLGLGIRLDAAKDIVDMDSVRNGDTSFDEAWDMVIDFYKNLTENVKKVNPNIYIVAEITDIGQLMQATLGPDTDVWNIDLSKIGSKYKNVDDAMLQFYAKTGITTEAGYSYTFTNLLHMFSADGENGDYSYDRISEFKSRMDTLLQTSSLDYISNIWTFPDNHDKPSVIHVMALDMELFHTSDLNPDFKNCYEDYEKAPYERRRQNTRISILQELTNSDRFEDMPLEAMMNIDNPEYFRTASPRSTAMSKLIRSAINDRLTDENTKNVLKSALVDLTNGNYLQNAENTNLQTINIPELKSLEAALDEILKNTDLKLTDSEKEAVIEYAKNPDIVKKFAVRGDFDWKTGEGNTHWTAQELQNRAKNVLNNSEWSFMTYSPYTVSVAALLLDAYETTVKNPDKASFTNGTREFVHKFNRENVQQNSSKLPYREDPQIAWNKKAYAARDIETVIEMVMQQAEFKTGKKFSKEEHDIILKELFESSTEPAIEKALMLSSFLAALPGVPTVFFRDILGALGFDEKTKNIYMQNRNTVKFSELEEGPLKEYRNRILDSFKQVMQVRDKMSAINNGGTPYIWRIDKTEALTMLYQDANENVDMAIMNIGGVNPQSRVVYDENIVKDKENAVDSINNNNKYVPVQERLELESIVLPATLALAAGTTFINIADKDKAKYIIEKLKNGAYQLVRADKKKIVLNGDTAKHGVMCLKKVKVAFRGKNINQQYHINTSCYNQYAPANVGKNFSVIAR